MDLGIANIIASSIIAAVGITVSIICVATPRIRKIELDNLRKELLDTLHGVEEMKKLEKSLEEQAGVSKREARKGYNSPEKFENARLQKRINQLENQLN